LATQSRSLRIINHINFRFQGIGQSYLANNISQASSHLVKNPKKAVLLRGSTDSQDNFIYFLNSDYTITVFQFAHEVNLAALTPALFNPPSEKNAKTHLFDVALQDMVAIDFKIKMQLKLNF